MQWFFRGCLISRVGQMDPITTLTGTVQGPGNRGLVGMSEPGREQGLKPSVLWQEGQVDEMTFGLP